MMRNERFAGQAMALATVAFLCATVAFAQTPSAHLARLRKLDISSEISDPRFGKKVNGVEHRKAFTALIGHGDKRAALELVESEQGESKKRLEKLEGFLAEVLADAEDATAAAAGPEEKKLRLEEMARKAQEGDDGALAELAALGPSCIPALVRLKGAESVMPTPEVMGVLAAAEARADEMLAKGGDGLDAEVLRALIEREQGYAAILKRAVIALEGIRRPYSHWLPFLYMYIVGFVPFAFGILASYVYYGGFRRRIVALIAGIYVFYVCFIGFFQLFAPWIG